MGQSYSHRADDHRRDDYRGDNHRTDNHRTSGCRTDSYEPHSDHEDCHYSPPTNETVEALLDATTTLNALFPDEVLCTIDDRSKRVYLDLSLSLAADIWDKLPLRHYLAIVAGQERAHNRMKSDHDVPTNHVRTPDRHHLMVLLAVQSILSDYLDNHGDSTKDRGNGWPDTTTTPPPSYSQSAETYDSDCNSKASQGGRDRSTSSHYDYADECTAPETADTALNSEVITSDLLPDADLSNIFGYNETSATKVAQTFEPKLRLCFPLVASILQAYRQAEADTHVLHQLELQRPFSDTDPSIGYFITKARVIQDELLLRTTCCMHAASPDALHRTLTSSVPETWLRPCRHIGSQINGDHVPLRNRRLGFDEFEEYASTHGNFALEKGPECNLAVPVYSCEYCYTDYTVRLMTRRGSEIAGFQSVEWLLVINVWHNAGSGKDAMERKWLRIAAAAPFSTLTVPRPGFSVGGVMRAFSS